MKLSILSLLVILFITLSATAQTTEFNYQGSLKDGANAANGNYDFEFLLFDALSGGSQVGSTLTRSTVAVANGTFSVKLDFGGQFPGASRFLEIHVRTAGGGAFTTLTPRQPVSSSPYAVQSLNAVNAANAVNATNATNAATATTATNATQLGGVTANQYVLTGDARLSDARAPTSGSANYIQNGTSQQLASNFNISGDGTAGGTLTGGTVKAITQYNIGNNRFLSTGTGAGTFANSNTFTGFFAGNSNTPDPGTGQNGNFNSFFGNGAGQNNTTGFGNSFFGNLTGQLNVTGTQNSFFGFQAGNKTTSSNNAFFGFNAGINNTNGTSNALVGTSAGSFNQIGNNNSFLGFQAGNTSNGDNNTFLGFQSGGSNTTGSSNTAIGASAGMGAINLTNATAIGAGANVNQSNSLILGSLNPGTNVGIGTTAPTERLHVVGNGLFTGNITVNGQLSSPIFNATTQFNLGGQRMLSVSGPFSAGLTALASNTFLGENAGVNTTPSGTINDPSGKFNTFVGSLTGVANTVGANNSFFGGAAGNANTVGSQNSFLGADAGRFSTTGDNNSFIGGFAGFNNSTGSNNSFVGLQAGQGNTTGANNSFFGYNAGTTNQTGSTNTVLGYLANLGGASLTNATSIGANSRVDNSNALVLGSVNGVNGATSNTNVGIGTTAPGVALDVQNTSAAVALRLRSTAGSSSIFLDRASAIAANSSQISFSSAGTADFGMGTSQGSAGNSDFSIYNYGTARNAFTIQRSTGSIGIGTTDPGTPAGENSLFAIVQNTPGKWSSRVRTSGIATGQSFGLLVDAGTNSSDITFQARSQAGTPLLTVQGNGIVAVSGALAVGNNAVIPSSGNVTFTGVTIGTGGLQIINLTGGGGGSPLCAAGSAPFTVGFCSSSYRYKTNITNYRAGYDIVRRLNPIGYDWKLGGSRDIGLGAEDVEKIDKRLVFYNDKGQVEGVRYDRLGVVLINAVKEQQTQIEAQDKKIQSLEEQIKLLRAIVCKTNSSEEICRR